MALLNSPSSKSPIWTRDRVSSPSRSHFSSGLKLILQTQVTNPEIATFQSLSKGVYATGSSSLTSLKISMFSLIFFEHIRECDVEIIWFVEVLVFLCVFLIGENSFLRVFPIFFVILFDML